MWTKGFSALFTDMCVNIIDTLLLIKIMCLADMKRKDLQLRVSHQIDAIQTAEAYLNTHSMLWRNSPRGSWNFLMLSADADAKQFL